MKPKKLEKKTGQKMPFKIILAIVVSVILAIGSLILYFMGKKAQRIETEIENKIDNNKHEINDTKNNITKLETESEKIIQDGKEIIKNNTINKNDDLYTKLNNINKKVGNK